MDEILMLQDEISELQSSLAHELVSGSPESDPAGQLALQSTLTVLAERMSTIKMKASGKQQLLEVSEQLALRPPLTSALARAVVLTHLGSFVSCIFIVSPLKRSRCRVSGGCREHSPVSLEPGMLFSPFCLISA